MMRDGVSRFPSSYLLIFLALLFLMPKLILTLIGMSLFIIFVPLVLGAFGLGYWLRKHKRQAMRAQTHRHSSQSQPQRQTTQSRYENVVDCEEYHVVKEKEVDK